MTLFPLFANLRGKRVLVVGGGVVAERKVKSLLAAGARITLGARHISSSLHDLHQQGRIHAIEAEFDPAWLDGVWLVVAATDDQPLNTRLAELADIKRIFINVVDDHALSSYQMPSIVDRSPLIIAISSGGTAPVLARRLRERIESLFDHSLGALAGLSARYRPAIRKARPDLRQRREFYDWLLDGPVCAALRNQQPELANSALQHALGQNQHQPAGRVILVGAGPGDPGLLTLKALRALNEADVILYDRLVSPEVLELARRDADQISVGKKPGEDHHATQARIHQLMRDHASAGKVVVRLKGGDAFVFGRGGEELEYLREHAIPYEVVPGITAALACAAYAGIPLTHRDHAQSVQLVTAHCRQGGQDHDWASLARSQQTLAFYMGISQLNELTTQLIRHGRSATTSFALIENGTRPNQRVMHGRLQDLPMLARQHAFEAPSLLLIGEVTALAQKLHWFGSSIEGEPRVALCA